MKAVFAAAVALVAAVFAVVTLLNLRGYRDSPTWIYVLVGVFWIVLALTFAAVAVRTARRR